MSQLLRRSSCLNRHDRSSSPRPQTPPYSQGAPTPPIHAAVPRSLAPPAGPRRSFPPPPSVEDEATSLAREHGPSSSVSSLDEEPPARGDIDQNPVIMEVHEYNPERRFVILTNPSEEDKSDASRKSQEPRASRDRKNRDNGSHEAHTTPKYDSDLKPNGGSTVDMEKPSLERRRSRQDLPRLETDMRSDRAPEHHRTRSAVNGSRPNDMFDSQSQNFGDNLLSPEVIKHGSSRREKVYNGYGQPQSASARPSSQRSHSHLADDRRPESSRTRGPQDPSPNKRSNSNFESGKSRRLSNERMGDSKYRDGYVPSRSSTMDRSPPYGRSDRDAGKRSSTYSSRDSRSRREDSWSSDEYAKSSRPYEQSRGKSVVHQENRDPLLSPAKQNTSRSGRSRSRGPSVSNSGSNPLPKIPAPQDAMPTNPRASVTFPLSMNEKVSSERGRSQLPYPEDDIPEARDPLDPHIIVDWPKQPQFERPPTASMPEFPSFSGSEACYSEGGKLAQPTTTPATPQSWKPPTFDPEKDGARQTNQVGTFRRYSEGADKNDAPGLPECERKKPVAGRTDWLTLPRTDFNICPDCYGSVFAKSDYRTQFQPMIWPADKPVACDFGSSAWYRIAWLLTLKNKMPDLRLFHQIASVFATSRNQPCPGARKAVRNWLTIRNPSTRRPVFNFIVCNQCAKTVEALLPNLIGLFVPVDPRSEPTRGMCSMHFAEKRKRFVMYFDAMETTSDKALVAKEAPNIQNLAQELEKLSMISECFEDRPVSDGYWHIMQYLPELTVCGECFNEVVRPRLSGDGVIARNFYMKPQRMPVATCQLYSSRMREIFKKACRYNDPRYLEDKVRERLQIERDIHAQLASLDREDHDESWVDEKMDKLIQEWKRWE